MYMYIVETKPSYVSHCPLVAQSGSEATALHCWERKHGWDSCAASVLSDGVETKKRTSSDNTTQTDYPKVLISYRHLLWRRS